MLRIGGVIDLVEVNGVVHGVRNSIAYFCDSNVVGLVLFAFVGIVFLKQMETGIVAHPKAAFLRLSVGQESKDVSAQRVVFAIFPVGAFVLCLHQRLSRRIAK